MKHEHHDYGLFPGGDPRRFSPDVESNLPQEIEAHKRACAEWDAREARGEFNEPVKGAIAVQGEGFSLIACGVSGFGMGSYSYDCDDPDCPDNGSPDIDPDDANAAFARWWDFDAQVVLDGETADEARLRIAFLAGFRARAENE